MKTYFKTSLALWIALIVLGYSLYNKQSVPLWLKVIYVAIMINTLVALAIFLTNKFKP